MKTTNNLGKTNTTQWGGQMLETIYFLKISYDGSYYHGFAKQSGSIVTIQGVLESLLTHLFHVPITISCASRTDRFVHAYDQAITFKLTTQIRINTNTINTILNESLPLDIRVKSVKIYGSQNPSPRFLCHEKIYLYKISFAKVSPWLSKYYYFVPRSSLVNLAQLSELLQFFVGEHNFKSYFNYFGKTKQNVNFFCKIIEFTFRLNERYLFFYVRGNRFGRNMVRLLIGDVLDFLQNKKSFMTIKTRIVTPSKHYLIFKAPPQGLYLYKTKFPKII